MEAVALFMCRSVPTTSRCVCPAMAVDAATLEAHALQLYDRLSTFEAMPGALRLKGRLDSELVDLPGASASRLAGAHNNLAAIAWELDVCRWAPDVVALSRTTQPPLCTAASVDVIAAGGDWWLEAKASLPFGLGSTAWADLAEQLARLNKNARSSFSGARRPRVLVVFRHACTAEVHAALLRLGVTPVSATPDGTLPEPALVASLMVPPEPARLQPPRLVLDVSTLLGLLSSSCRTPPDEAQLRDWAAPNEHWQRSLDEEAQAPLLPSLRKLLRRHALWLVRPAELERCDALVAMAGGTAERARWVALRQLITVGEHLELQRQSDVSEQPRVAASTDSQPGGTAECQESERSLGRSLGAMRPPHRQLLIDAAKAEALLCTANARLIRRVPKHVHLRVFVHPARWLVGDAIPLSAKEAAALKEQPQSVLGSESNEK